MTAGLYAAVLDWSEQATLCEQLVVNAQAEVDAAVANIAATNTSNASVVLEAQRQVAYAIINATLNGPELTLLLNYDYNYISPATDVATLQYVCDLGALHFSMHVTLCCGCTGIRPQCQPCSPILRPSRL